MFLTDEIMRFLTQPGQEGVVKLSLIMKVQIELSMLKLVTPKNLYIRVLRNRGADF